MLPERIAVVGNAGSGKTTLARELAIRTGLPHVELDALYHLPGWRPNPRFRDAVTAACPADGRWVVDGNHSVVGDITRPRAEFVVWLDYPRRTVMRRVLRRTLGRGLRGTELWNGNRQPLRTLLRPDPNDNIVLWSWTRHAHYRALYGAEADGRWLRLRSPTAAAAWLSSAVTTADQPPG